MKINSWDELTPQQKQQILSRPALPNHDNIAVKTREIINTVKQDGDKALLAMTAQFDNVQLTQMQVQPDEFIAAQQAVSVAAAKAMQFAQKQIETCHQAQLPTTKVVETCPGVTCERQARPISRVGLYVPGGTAPLVSTVLMLAIPAKIAGCPLRILCTPPNREGGVNPYLLVAAQMCGIDKVYKVGGAQAIAAMAYGTETIPKVDKIFGPGNAWVTQAKMIVAETISGAAIDMPAGPSEVVVIADEEANPAFIASDLLSQAEHGVDSQVILVTTAAILASKVNECLRQQLEKLSRQSIATASLTHGKIIVVNDIIDAFTVSNRYAPEHLILQINNPENYLDLVENAGAVFLGAYTPETVGDYVTGSNHVLPTGGYARSVSGLSTDQFMKFINFQTVTKQGLKNIGPSAEQLALIEGLDGHQQAVTLRLKEIA